jgi:hypothetical protein
MWAGFEWLMMGTFGGSNECCNEPLGPMKSRGFLVRLIDFHILSKNVLHVLVNHDDKCKMSMYMEENMCFK